MDIEMNTETNVEMARLSTTLSQSPMVKPMPRPATPNPVLCRLIPGDNIAAVDRSDDAETTGSLEQTVSIRIALNAVIAALTHFVRLRGIRHVVSSATLGRSGRHAHDALADIPAGKKIDEGIRRSF